MPIDSKKVNFPTWVLEDCESALCLFCAAFGGKNDVQYVWDAGIEYPCFVDIDGRKLWDLMLNSPASNASFVTCDAFEFVKKNADKTNNEFRINGGFFDVTIADPWTNQVDDVLDMLNDLKAITRKYIVLTVTDDHLHRLPDDITLMKRNNNGVYWAVFSL